MPLHEHYCSDCREVFEKLARRAGEEPVLNADLLNALGSPAELQLLDAARFERLEPTLPALIGGVTNALLLQRARAKLLRVYPSGHSVQVMWTVRGDKVQARTAILGRLRFLRRLASGGGLYVPPLATAEATTSLPALERLVAHLRGPRGCPWDREQTLASLAPFAIEEAYEVVDAVQHGKPHELRDELGDLLLQVLMQSCIAAETGQFDLAGVMRGLGEKLVRRHPHVFGEARASTAGEVLRRWDDLKAAERNPTESVLAKVPRSSPALKTAQELQKKASKAGFDWPSREGIEAKLREELKELLAEQDVPAIRHELGDVLFILAKLGLSWDIDAEDALREANARFTTRFQYIERVLQRRRESMREVSLEELLGLWRKAKTRERKTARASRADGRGAQI